jgi:hypothetical protein
MTIIEPLSITTLAAYLRQRGVLVDMLSSLHLPGGPSELVDSLTHLDFSAYSLVGVSAAFPPLEPVLRVASVIRKSYSGLLCVGGHAATLDPESLLPPGGPFDLAVFGEGEETLATLVTHAIEGSDWKHIRGIGYREGDRIIKTPPCLGLTDLDVFPYAARDFLAQQVRGYGPSNITAAILASRGCVHRCTFCALAAAREHIGHTYRVRSVDSVVGELKQIIVDYGVTNFHFEDDNFLMGLHAQPERVRRFAETVSLLPAPISFSCGLRADAVDVTSLQLLRQAGLTRLFIGIESFHDGELRMYRKGHDAATVRRALEICSAVGFSPAVDAPLRLVVGLFTFGPDSTLKMIRRTYDYIVAYGLPVKKLLSRVRATNGTALARTLSEQGRLLEGGMYRFSCPRVSAFYETATNIAEVNWHARDAIRDIEKYLSRAPRPCSPHIDYLRSLRHSLDLALYRRLSALLDELLSGQPVEETCARHQREAALFFEEMVRASGLWQSLASLQKAVAPEDIPKAEFAPM